jgi:transcription-repair coupling factor (superfamily II helicase)
MSAAWAELAEMEASGKKNSAEAKDLLRNLQDSVKAAQVAQFWADEQARFPLEAVPYAGMTAAAQEAFERRRKEETESQGWGDLKPEEAITAMREKFAARREQGMLKVRQKYAEGGGVEEEEEGEEDGEKAEEEEEGTRLAKAEQLHPATFNTSVDPERLIPGEYIVHAKVGIGQFLKLGNIPGKKEKYIIIMFADKRAKIKASLASKKLYRYQSPGLGDEKDGVKKGKGPKLSKIGDTSAWEKRRERSRRGIRANVVNVMEVYMERMLQSRPPYEPVSPEIWAQFEALFPFDLTPDQASAIADVATDLSNDTPMDRLVIGDVGFGKTEVAMRSIFRVVQAGKQVFVLCPTTLLAKQHATLVAKRLEPFGHRVELLNRFRSAKERIEILQGIRDASVQVVVGTQVHA